MHRFFEQTYYALAASALLGGLFVFSGAPVDSDLAVFKNDLQNQFADAFVQTIGDQPVTEVALIWNAVNDFYIESADAMIALLTQPESDEDIIYVAAEVYKTFAKAANEIKGDGEETRLAIPSNFMAEKPLYNIIPDQSDDFSQNTPQVAGLSTVSEEFQSKMESADRPVNEDMPWVTMKDNITGQLYCIAVYNGTPSTYLGPCKYDYR